MKLKWDFFQDYIIPHPKVNYDILALSSPSSSDCVQCRFVVCFVYWGYSAWPLKVYISLDVLCIPQNNYSTGIIHLSELRVEAHISVENDIKLRRSRSKWGVNLSFVVGISITRIDSEKIKPCTKIVNK